MKYSNSSKRAFQECPQKYELAHIEGLAPVNTAQALSFGKAFDNLCENGDADLSELDDKHADLLNDIFPLYKEKFLSNVIAQEIMVEIPLKYHPKDSIVMKLDGLVYEDKYLYLLERKTTAENVIKRAERLAHESQIWLYLHGLLTNWSKIIEALKLPESTEFGGIYADIIEKRKLPSYPKILKSGKPSFDKRQNTTTKLFYECCYEIGYELSAEEKEKIEESFPDKVISMIREPISNVMLTYSKKIDRIIKDFRVVANAKKFPMNDFACVTMTRKCPFYELCYADDENEREFLKENLYKQSDYYLNRE